MGHPCFHGTEIIMLGHYIGLPPSVVFTSFAVSQHEQHHAFWLQQAFVLELSSPLPLNGYGVKNMLSVVARQLPALAVAFTAPSPRKNHLGLPPRRTSPKSMVRVKESSPPYPLPKLQFPVEESRPPPPHAIIYHRIRCFPNLEC